MNTFEILMTATVVGLTLALILTLVLWSNCEGRLTDANERIEHLENGLRITSDARDGFQRVAKIHSEEAKHLRELILKHFGPIPDEAVHDAITKLKADLRKAEAAAEYGKRMEGEIDAVCEWLRKEGIDLQQQQEPFSQSMIDLLVTWTTYRMEMTAELNHIRNEFIKYGEKFDQRETASVVVEALNNFNEKTRALVIAAEAIEKGRSVSTAKYNALRAAIADLTKGGQA